MNAGKVIIETDIDNSGVEEGISKLEAKYKNRKLELDATTKELAEEESILSQMVKKADELDAKHSDIRKKIQEQRDFQKLITEESPGGGRKIPQENLPQYNKSRREEESLVAQLSPVSEEAEKLNEEISKQEKIVDRLNLKWEKQKTTVQEIQTELDQNKLKEMPKTLENIGNSVSKVAKKVGRWGLALFSVRSAYFFIRQAMSTITEYDKQLGADVQYMKNAIAFSLEPIIRGIINLVRRLLKDIQLAIYYLTGKNIFANANKNLQSAVGSAKELKKQLAGFDEMNVLNDNSSSGAGGGVGPSLDLAELDENNTKLEKFGNLIKIIGLALTGLGIALASLSLGIAGVVTFIVGLIIENWEKIKAFLQKGIDWLTGKSDWIHEHLGDTVGNIYDFIVQTLQDILNWLDVVIRNIEKIFSGIITFIKGVFTGDWKKAWTGIKDIFVGIWNIIKSTFVTVFNFIKNLVVTVGTTVGNIIAGAFKAVVNGVLFAIEKILNAPIRAINGLIKVINKVPGINIGKLATFSLPRLAKGGIVNMPGKGVPIGGALAGEHRMEGVIPLTDSQQMSLLGEAIGKYITVNANITNTMNGRVISRELQKVQNNSDFAYNR